MPVDLLKPAGAALDPAMLPLLREIGELKRIRSAGREGSIATRLFASGWSALIAEESPGEVALRTTADALAAARLGDLDVAKLAELGVTRPRIDAIRRAALDELAAPIDTDLAEALRDALGSGSDCEARPLRFVALLTEQPRAGVTCPGRPRLMLQPAENHAEHSVVVAVYAVLLAPLYGADTGTAFLAGMAHHLHSAAMPDSGYAGEILLGDDLAPVMAAARARAMADLPAALRGPVDAALALIADDAAPEARAFHAADAIDRVLETEQHLRGRAATMAVVLGDYGLVHDGPVKPFHDRILGEIGLA